MRQYWIHVPCYAAELINLAATFAAVWMYPRANHRPANPPTRQPAQPTPQPTNQPKQPANPPSQSCRKVASPVAPFHSPYLQIYSNPLWPILSTVSSIVSRPNLILIVLHQKLKHEYTPVLHIATSLPNPDFTSALSVL